MKKNFFGCLLRFLCFVSFLALVTACPSGVKPEPSPPGPDPTAQDMTLENAYNALSIPQEIADEYELPTKISGFNAVTITWTSTETGIIDDSNKIILPSTSDKNATLTATLEYKGNSKTKVFSVKLIATSTELSDEEIVSLAKDQLTFIYDQNNYADQIVPVQNELQIRGKTVTITWSKVGNDKHLKYDSTKNQFTIHRDIIDTTNSVTANLSLNLASDTKIFPVPIARVPIIRTYGVSTNGIDTYEIYFKFDGTNFEYKLYETTDEGESVHQAEGRRGTYTVNNGVITITVTEVQSKRILNTNLGWYKKGEKSELDELFLTSAPYNYEVVTQKGYSYDNDNELWIDTEYCWDDSKEWWEQNGAFVDSQNRRLLLSGMLWYEPNKFEYCEFNEDHTKLVIDTDELDVSFDETNRSLKISGQLGTDTINITDLVYSGYGLFEY